MQTPQHNHRFVYKPHNRAQIHRSLPPPPNHHSHSSFFLHPISYIEFLMHRRKITTTYAAADEKSIRKLLSSPHSFNFISPKCFDHYPLPLRTPHHTELLPHKRKKKKKTIVLGEKLFVILNKFVKKKKLFYFSGFFFFFISSRLFFSLLLISRDFA